MTIRVPITYHNKNVRFLVITNGPAYYRTPKEFGDLCQGDHSSTFDVLLQFQCFFLIFILARCLTRYVKHNGLLKIVSTWDKP